MSTPAPATELTLLERMKALREREQVADPSPRSDAQQSVTLSTFLVIYNRAPKDCCIGYSEGIKVLHRWLTFPSSPLNLEVGRFPKIEDTSWKVPASMRGYEVSELATILSGEIYGLEHNRFARAIALTTVDLINKGVL